MPTSSDRARSNRPFIAADVGGTHVRVGLIRVRPTANRPIDVTTYQVYRCADYEDLADILDSFMQTLGDRAEVRECAIACAGHARDDGTVISVNLPWPVSLHELARRLRLSRVDIVNDFEAVAYATGYVDRSEVHPLMGPQSGTPGPVLMVGPGTGFGSAVWIPSAPHPVVLATEAGQATLPVSTPLEMALLTEMLRHRPHVTIEHALSGPGLVNVHAALCALHGVPCEPVAPDDITASARSGDLFARLALDTFCDLLGSVVGSMTLTYGAYGGVYLAGGILPRIRDFLDRSRFSDRFLDKGPMRQALEHVPVKLVEHGQLGVIGAANWFLDRRQD